MNELQLSKRLEVVANFVKVDANLADIGSDHAYLPIYLIKQGKCRKAIAGEINAGPLTSAEAQITKHGLTNQIKAKLGNGLQVMEGEEIDTVVIAGMGGPLIASILHEGKEQLKKIERLILQPNVAADHIRRWLLHHGWALIDEAIIEEDGHTYEVLVAEKGDGKNGYSNKLDKELLMGPFLLKQKNSAFQKKWLRELAQLESVYKQIQEASDQEKLAEKKEAVKRKLTWIYEEDWI